MLDFDMLGSIETLMCYICLTPQEFANQALASRFALHMTIWSFLTFIPLIYVVLLIFCASELLCFCASVLQCPLLYTSIFNKTVWLRKTTKDNTRTERIIMKQSHQIFIIKLCKHCIILLKSITDTLRENWIYNSISILS